MFANIHIGIFQNSVKFYFPGINVMAFVWVHAVRLRTIRIYGLLHNILEIHTVISLFSKISEMLKGYCCESGMSLGLQMEGLFKWPFDLKATKIKVELNLETWEILGVEIPILVFRVVYLHMEYSVFRVYLVYLMYWEQV